MTSFGSGEYQQAGSTYVCEIKTLNSRYLEVNVRIPKFLMSVEPELIAKVKETLSRGKADVIFNLDLSDSDFSLPILNEQALDHYLDIVEKINHKLRDRNLIDSNSKKVLPNAYSLLKIDGVLDSKLKSELREKLIDQNKVGIIKSLERALVNVIDARQKEGHALKLALEKFLDELEQKRQEIENRSEDLRELIYGNYIKRLENLQKKITDANLKFANDLPEDRLMVEVAILAEKSDIAEEIERLQTHINEFRKSLDKPQPVGRNLDFLCQEMHREINTMSNKLVQSDSSKITRSMKEIVERIRQQVQNIE